MTSVTTPSVLGSPPVGSNSTITKVAVWGMGSIGRRHYEILATHPGAEVVGVPAREGRAADLQRAGLHAVDSLAEAVESGVEAVIVATDTGRHEADTISALLLRCDVLVEKPMAVDALAANRMVQASNASGSHLNVASCLRFDSGLQWLRAQLPGVGSIDAVEAECLSWLPSWRPGRDHLETYAARPDEGGVLRDLIHEIDYLLWLFGPMELSSVELANSGQLGLPAGVEESAVMHARADAGRVPLEIRLDFASKRESRFLRVQGSEAALMWDYRAGTGELRSPDGDVYETVRWDKQLMYELQIDAWLAHVNGFPNSSLSTAAEGVLALSVCDEARASGRWDSGQP